jgi:hypothetical protein
LLVLRSCVVLVVLSFRVLSCVFLTSSRFVLSCLVLPWVVLCYFCLYCLVLCLAFILGFLMVLSFLLLSCLVSSFHSVSPFVLVLSLCLHLSVQLRLWGSHGQKAMAYSSVCLVGNRTTESLPLFLSCVVVVFVFILTAIFVFNVYLHLYLYLVFILLSIFVSV